MGGHMGGQVGGHAVNPSHHHHHPASGAPGTNAPNPGNLSDRARFPGIPASVRRFGPAIAVLGPVILIIVLLIVIP
jgi:hypothetical protein